MAIRIGLTLRGNPEPLLIHVVGALHKVLRVALVGPAGRGVLNLEILRLLVLPPAIRPLEHEAADGVSYATPTVRLGIDLFPLCREVLGLREVILAPAPGVEGIGAKLRKEDGDAQRLIDARKEVARGQAPIDIGAQDVQIRCVLLDELKVLEVAIADADRVVRVDLLDRGDGLAPERIERCGVLELGVVLHADRQILDLEARPVKAVVVLISEQPQEHAFGVLVGVHGRQRVRDDRLPHLRIAVVDVGDPRAVHGDAIPAKERVDHGVDPVLFVDPFHPAGRNHRVLPNGVDPHVPKQLHLRSERRLDEGIVSPPEVVGVVLADGHVAPVHPPNERLHRRQ